MAGGWRHRVRSVFLAVVTCALLTVTIFAATHSVWHFDAADPTCAVCRVGELPCLVQPVGLDHSGALWIEDRVRCPEPVQVASRPIRIEPSRGPPA